VLGNGRSQCALWRLHFLVDAPDEGTQGAFAVLLAFGMQHNTVPSLLVSGTFRAHGPRAWQAVTLVLGSNVER
jgi:hypothetical protein